MRASFRLLAVAVCLIALAGTAPAAGSQGFDVAATGDVLPHGTVVDAARKPGGGWHFGRFFSEIRPLISGAGLAICHQETVLGSGKPLGFPLFRGPREIARAEARVGWDACSTASNHSFDHGRRGIRSTLAALDANGIAHAGTFLTRKSSNRAHLIYAAGHRIALLSYAGGVNPSGFDAPAWQPERIRRERILADARRARAAGAEAVIVNLHWGHDVEPRPGQRRMEFARNLLSQSEISAIIGQGPHLVWPIRFFSGKPAVFSEGNLLYKHDPHGLGWQESGIVALLHFRERRGRLRADRVRYVPLTQRRSDLKLFTAQSSGTSTRLKARIRDDYQHATKVIGRGPRVSPVPARLSPKRSHEAPLP